jgi:hypothetical protein
MPATEAFALAVGELQQLLRSHSVFDDAARRSALERFAHSARDLGQSDELVRAVVASVYSEPAQSSELRRRALTDLDAILGSLGN